MPKARHAASSGWKKEILGSEALCGGIKKKPTGLLSATNREKATELSTDNEHEQLTEELCRIVHQDKKIFKNFGSSQPSFLLEIPQSLLGD